VGVGKKGGRDGDLKEADGRIEKWSWVGERSPLMGGKEEAGWVLERLVRTLEWELEDSRREELEKRGETEEDPVHEMGRESAGVAGEGSENKLTSQEKERS
jgi:hypothetical protein